MHRNPGLIRTPPLYTLSLTETASGVYTICRMPTETNPDLWSKQSIQREDIGQVFVKNIRVNVVVKSALNRPNDNSYSREASLHK